VSSLDENLPALPLGGDPFVDCEKSADLPGKSLVIGNPPRQVIPSGATLSASGRTRRHPKSGMPSPKKPMIR
jgi:hypothetical protein